MSLRVVVRFCLDEYINLNLVLVAGASSSKKNFSPSIVIFRLAFPFNSKSNVKLFNAGIVVFVALVEFVVFVEEVAFVVLVVVFTVLVVLVVTANILVVLRAESDVGGKGTVVL